MQISIRKLRPYLINEIGPRSNVLAAALQKKNARNKRRSTNIPLTPITAAPPTPTVAAAEEDVTPATPSGSGALAVPTTPRQTGSLAMPGQHDDVITR
jgi:hypothetical protein